MTTRYFAPVSVLLLALSPLGFAVVTYNGASYIWLVKNSGVAPGQLHSNFLQAE